MSTSVYYLGKVKLRVAMGGRLQLLLASLQLEFPKLRIAYKNDHWYWRSLMNSKMSTTLKNLVVLSNAHMVNIALRKPGWEDKLWSLLMHEREHLRQIKKYTFGGFLFLYFLVFFPIVFAYARARFERAGYLQTLRCWYALNPSWAKSPAARRWWVGQFTGWAYGAMWPFKKTVGGWFDAELARLEAGV